jgi:hypothetical protein
MSPNAFRSVLEIDLLGTYHVLRTGYEFLRKPGSVVINISRVSAVGVPISRLRGNSGAWTC